MYPTVRSSAGQGGASEEEEEEDRGGEQGTAGQPTSTSLFTELQEETDLTLVQCYILYVCVFVYIWSLQILGVSI